MYIFDILFVLSKDGVGECDFIFRYVEDDKKSPLTDLLSKLFVSQWPKSEKQFDVVRHMVTWSTFKQYLGIFRKL